MPADDIPTFGSNSERPGANADKIRDELMRADAKSAGKALTREESPGAAAHQPLLRRFGHELRNHVAPIQNVLFLLRRSSTEPALQSLVDVAERQLTALVKDFDALTDAERVSRGAIDLGYETFDLVDVVTTAIGRYQAIADQQGLHIRAHLPSRPVMIRGDVQRIDQVLTTLLANAIAYNREASEIVVTVDATVWEVTLRVRDTGDGMTVATLDQLCEFFPEHDGGRHDSGLSLAVANKLVAMHGGFVIATSDGEGLGSEFAVHLPHDGVARRVAPPASGISEREKIMVTAQNDTPSRGRRVLICDDSAPLRETLSAVLTHMGHDVRAAADGPEALEIAQRWEPEFALLDIYMPKLNGFAVARELRARVPAGNMRLIMMSGHDLDEATLREAGQAGFDHCIRQGFHAGRT